MNVLGVKVYLFVHFFDVFVGPSIEFDHVTLF
jgi:hypothetical protein